MLVSHTTGKKTSTAFELVDQVGFCQHWQARATYPRRHQILLHAYESGLPVVGDRIYAKDPLPLLSDFKRSYQTKYDEEERPLYDGPAVFLKELRFADGRVVECPNPPRWSGLLKQLKMHTHSQER
jgi:23S rRNA pseudouridine955/2504/2580 synthase/23S rRNA pseudouridine1911/1915/1917 synthase